MQLLIVLLLLIRSEMEPPRIPVDIIEINSILSSDAECPANTIIFEQVILWRWYPKHASFHVVNWYRRHDSGDLRYIDGRWEMTIYVSGIPRYVAVSPHWRATRTLHDPEVLDRRLWPLEVRDRAPH